MAASGGCGASSRTFGYAPGALRPLPFPRAGCRAPPSVRFLFGALVALGCTTEAEPTAQPAVDAPDTATETPVDVGPETPVLPPGPCDNLDEGASCDDGSACTLGETCQGGFCVAASFLTCTGGESCVPALCDPAVGCVTRTLPDGAPCTAPCFGAGRCTGGVCLGVTGSEAECPTGTDDVCVERLLCEMETGGCTVPELKLSCPSDSRCLSNAGKLECIRDHPTYCRPCLLDSECADPENPTRLHRCLAREDGSGSFCGSTCTEATCPDGSTCDDAREPPQCFPIDGVCRCDPLWASLGYRTDCARTNEFGTCAGSRRCAPGGLTECDAPTPFEERCNGKDDDCDGEIDEGLADLCGPAGACCLPDGTCAPRFYQGCLALGGHYGGVGITCSQAACGTDSGACCGLDGCLEVVPSACATSYRGDGSTCASGVCTLPPALGACCSPDGECAQVEVAPCAASGGFFSGVDTTCAEAACVPTGACCLGDKTCVVIGAKACFDQGGQSELGTACLNGGCPIPKGSGACCSGAACSVLTASSCAALPGQFLPSQACLGQCTGPALGPCCHVDGSCLMVPVEACDPSFSNWSGAPAVCPTACDAPKGACCGPQYCYPGLSEAQCIFVNGAWLGEASACDAGCPP